MDPCEPLLRHTEHRERVVVSQVLLDGEGKAGKVFKSVKVVRMNTVFVEMRAVEGRIRIGVLKRLFHPRKLQRCNFVT